jgi:hypothetical protein
MSSWISYDRNNLGKPVPKLQPGAGTTHVVTVPGTGYLAFLGDAYMQPTLDRAGRGRPARVEQLLAALARTTVSSQGRRRSKAVPMLQTITEFQASQSRQAA